VSAPGPAPAGGGLAGAIAASLLLHGALLASLQSVPRSWNSGAPLGDPQSAKSVRVRFVEPVAPVAPKAAVADPQASADRPVPRPAPPAGAPHGAAKEPVPGILPPVRYYTALELDRRPQPLQNIEPVYPALALAPVGRVTLALYISEDGEVERLEVESADQTGDFAGSARKAFDSARFLPGVRNGVAVKSLMRIEVRFGEPLQHTAGGQESVEREKFIPKVRVRPRK
jgi:TonB family protein